MKYVENLDIYLKKYTNKLIKNIMNEQSNTAFIIQQDAKLYAPDDTGAYKESIELGETEFKDGRITTSVYTEATVTTKNGTEYNLGRILEEGTEPHAIPNAWGKGYTFGYVDKKGIYRKGTLDPDWHPGTMAQPHFLPALNKNVALYKSNILKAIKEAK